MDDAKALFYTNRQVHDESDANYLTKFKDICQVIEHSGGSLCDDQALIDKELVNLVILAYATDKEKEEYRAEARVRAKNKALAVAFFLKV